VWWPRSIETNSSLSTETAVHGFDATGEQRWSVDVPNLGAATAHDGVLYTIAGDASLEITAFALR
jgi:hypothetical protein